MADDFFSDLLPLKPKQAVQKSSQDIPDNGSNTTLGVARDGAHTGSSSYQQVGDLLGNGPREEIPLDFANKQPEYTEKDEHLALTMEKVVHAALHKFANALQPVLASMTRQMEDVSSKVDQITSLLHASQTGTKQNDAILEHLNSLASGMKDLQHSVQLVSDRQEAADSEARKRDVDARKAPEQAKSEAPVQPETAPAKETQAAITQTPSPAASLASNPSAVLPPGPALPMPTVPPLPATAPPATPAEAPTPLPPSPPTPLEAAQHLQRYGSTASSHQGFTFGPPHPQQPQQQPQAQFSPAPPSRPSQPGFPTNQPQAQQTPPYGGPPQQTHHTTPPNQQAAGQQYPGGQSSQPQYNSSAPQSYNVSVPQQQPGRQFYNSGTQQPPSGFSNQDPYSGSYGGSATSQGFANQNSGPSSFPPASAGPPRFGPSGPTSGFGPPPSRIPAGQSYGPPSRPGPQRPPSQQSPQSVPLEKVVDDIANMGFSRHEARAVIQELQDRGQAVDLNVVLDRLMNGPRR